MLVGFTNESMAKKHLDYGKIPNIDYSISSTRHSEKTLEFLRGRNLSEDYVFKKDDGGVEIPSNRENKIGSFVVYVYEIEEKHIGIKVSFDDLSIFFAFTTNLSYNESEFIANNVKDIDIVYAEYNTEIMRLISSKVKIARPYIKTADYCYSGYGNIIATKNGENLKVRCLD